MFLVVYLGGTDNNPLYNNHCGEAFAKGRPCVSLGECTLDFGS